MDFRRPLRSSWIDRRGGKKHDTKGMERGNMPEKDGKKGRKRRYVIGFYRRGGDKSEETGG